MSAETVSELERLRARVAELEQERAATNALVLDLTVALRVSEGHAPSQVIPVVDDVPVPVVLVDRGVTP